MIGKNLAYELLCQSLLIFIVCKHFDIVNIPGVINLFCTWKPFDKQNLHKRNEGKLEIEYNQNLHKLYSSITFTSFNLFMVSV